jgi:hypothetical protein
MKLLHSQIEERKRAIEDKKKHLGKNYESTKKQLTPSKGISLLTLGGIVIGFLLLPKKLKLFRKLFKFYTLSMTLKQVADAIPHHLSPLKKQRHSNK